MTKPDLDTDVKDVAASALRGLASCIPNIGGLVAEVVNYIIPGQKLERISDFLKRLDSRVGAIDQNLFRALHRLREEHGLDLFEEGVVQASRALTADRRERIANLLGCSLTKEELNYEESRKLLNLLRELTDPELLLLIFYSKPLISRSVFHRRLMKKHPDILRPASKEVGISKQEIERGALQNSYHNTLERLGLIDLQKKPTSLTSLGRLLLRYIQ